MSESRPAVAYAMTFKRVSVSYFGDWGTDAMQPPSEDYDWYQTGVAATTGTDGTALVIATWMRYL